LKPVSGTAKATVKVFAVVVVVVLDVVVVELVALTADVVVLDGAVCDVSHTRILDGWIAIAPKELSFIARAIVFALSSNRVALTPSKAAAAKTAFNVARTDPSVEAFTRFPSWLMVPEMDTLMPLGVK